MPPITVQQVAKAAGVSRSTANKVLLGEAHLFRENTAKKVLDAAKTLGYRPNLNARGLRERRTFLIGTLLSSVNAALAYDLYAGVQQVAADHGCAPITFSCPDAEHESRSIQLCQDRQVDAMLVNTAPRTSTPENQQLLGRLAKEGLPMVELFGRNLPGVPSIVSDFDQAGFRSTAKLIDSGLKKIVYWSPAAFDDASVATPTNWFALDMYRGYQRAMRGAGLVDEIAYHDRQSLPQAPPPTLLSQAKQLLVDRPGIQAVVSPAADAADAVSQVIHHTPTLVAPGFAQASFLAGNKPIGIRDRRVAIRIRARAIGEAAATMAFQQINDEQPDDLALVPDIDAD